jgi:hypothetical protein
MSTDTLKDIEKLDSDLFGRGGRSPRRLYAQRDTYLR